MGYEWLAEALAALRDIEPYEVIQALSAQRRLPLAGLAGGVRVVVICARTRAGRPLVVAIRKAGAFDQIIIGAREMTPEELARFERWEAEG